MIRLSQSSISQQEVVAVTQVLHEDFLGMGEQVKLFEEELKFFFKRDVSCVSSGTAALHLALEAIGLSKGDQVLVPSLTYVASFQAITATGATPVACDICTDTLTIDFNDAARRMSSSVKAIMPVHYAGAAINLDDIQSFAKKYGIRVVEDAAHAFGSEWRDVKVGQIGDITCFSFDGIKNITAGEGGCIVTSDKNISEYVKDARLLGVVNDTENGWPIRDRGSLMLISKGGDIT